MQDEITVTLDEDDFVHAYRPAPRSKRAASLLLALAAAIALLIVLLLALFPDARLAFARSPLLDGLLGAVILAAALVVALLVAAPGLRRRAARNTRRDFPGMTDPIDYAFDEDAFAARSTYSQARYPWEQLWDWRETDRIVLILPTPRNFYVVPKRALDPEALDRLRRRLARTRRRAALDRKRQSAERPGR
jgi:hypothetical protein